jgi:protein O-GlcNAc transferase
MSFAPQMPEPLSLALRHHRSGRLHEADALYRQFLSEHPSHTDALQWLGVLSHQLGRSDEAVVLLNRAISLNPSVAEYYTNLGAVLAGRRQWQDGAAAFRRAIVLRPDVPEAHHNLGKVLLEQGRRDEAIESFRRAVALRPDYADALHNLGDLLQEKGESRQAIDVFKRALTRKPDSAELWNNLGNAYSCARQLEAAIASYRRAVAIKPGSPETLTNLAVVLADFGDVDDAMTVCRRAIDLRPGLPKAYFSLAHILRRSDRLDDAVDAYRHAIALRPDFADAHANLGNSLRDRGDLDEALACYQRAMSLTDQAWVGSCLLFSSYFHSRWDPQRIHDAHVQWNGRYARHLAPSVLRFQNDRTPHRRLRIGYVSPDFRRHSQSQFTIPLLSRHDHSNFEIVCYSNVEVPDELTERIKGYADSWRPIAGLSDEQVAELIGEDRIDILVDLTMHMQGSRLMVFARKPAPVQVTWLAYPGTTGLTAIDYRLSDPHLDPPDSDRFHVERTVRLPETFWCYDPLSMQPHVNGLPALSTGILTFGCLNNFAKVTDQTLELWARVLNRIDKSRLLLLAPKGNARHRVVEKFAREGVESSRIEFIDRQPRDAYLATYHRIDLCLDTIPYPGHTTTLDSLWMGVPPITLTGNTTVSRGGLSLLANVQLEKLVAKTADEFVNIAADVSKDPASLATLRSELRERMRSSPLMDAPRFAQNVEAVYRRIWTAWCAQGAS